MNEETYTKEQLLASETYAGRRDLLEALLDPAKAYTHAEVKQAISEFLRKVVH